MGSEVERLKMLIFFIKILFNFLRKKGIACTQPRRVAAMSVARRVA